MGATLLRIWPLEVTEKFNPNVIPPFADIEGTGSYNRHPDVTINYMSSGRGFYDIKFTSSKTLDATVTRWWRFDQFLPKVSKYVRTFELYVQINSIAYQRVGMYNVDQGFLVTIVPKGSTTNFKISPIN